METQGESERYAKVREVMSRSWTSLPATRTKRFADLIENGTLTRVWYLDRPRARPGRSIDPSPGIRRIQHPESRFPAGRSWFIIMSDHDTFQGDQPLASGSNFR